MKEQFRQSDEKIDDGFFFTPVFQALTIGIPFCVFKLLFGLLALRAGANFMLFCVFACLVIVWALADLIMNLTRVVYHLIGRASPIEYCTIAQFGRLFRKPRLFLAIDTLVSFSIISFVLWSGWVKMLEPHEAYFWFAATTLNLLSVSIVNIWLELRHGR